MKRVTSGPPHVDELFFIQSCAPADFGMPSSAVLLALISFCYPPFDSSR